MVSNSLLFPCCGSTTLCENSLESNIPVRARATGQGAGPKAENSARARQNKITRVSDREMLYTRTSDYRQQKREEMDVLASAVQKAKLWIKDVMEEIQSKDEARAHLALKSVLHTLRDRLTVEEAVHVGAQLPTIIRGIYYEGRVPSGKPIKYSRAEFVETVRGYFMNLSGINHTEIVRAVFRVLEKHISAGEIENIFSTLPEDYRELFGETVLQE